MGLLKRNANVFSLQVTKYSSLKKIFGIVVALWGVGILLNLVNYPEFWMKNQNSE